MCGLLFSTRPRDPRDAAWREAVHVMECRGPDARRQVHTSAYSAAHSRLAVIGLGAVGQQPYTQDPEVDLLVFNGEIYNYRELAVRYSIKADSDTQVLYHMLSNGLDKDLSDIRGMFAFVYWRASHETIIAARDFFGIKPLYLAHGPDGSLSFASVASALVPLASVREPDSDAVAAFLATGYVGEGESAFSGVEKCPAGLVTTWRRKGGGWHKTVDRLGIDSWPALPTAEALRDSVAAHLVSDVPVGVLLSGGVDSTLLAAMATELVDELHTFSLTNPATPSIDESAYARWNAAQLGTRHVEVPFVASTSLPVITALISSTGEPFGDAAFVPLAVLCQQVAHEAKVVLAGEGADELFGGYRRYGVERYRYHRLTRMPLRGLARITHLRRRPADTAPSHHVRTWAHWAEADDYLAHSHLMSSEWTAVSAALPDASSRALAVRHAAWASLDSRPQSLHLPRHRAYDLVQWLPNVFLEKSDRASMLHGVEVRVPFLDPVVARSSTTFSSRGTSKLPLREALIGAYPNVRLPARKMGLSVATADLIRTSGLDEFVRFALNDSASLVRTLEEGDTSALDHRASLSPTLAFRLGVLALWQHIWLAG